MYNKIFLIIIFLNLVILSKAYTVENKILFQVDNEIITTIDIYEESKILSFMSPNIKNLDDKKIFEISKNSLISEKIKKIEILKNFKKINIDQEYIDEAIKLNFKKVEVSNLEEFKSLLKINDISYENLKNKITLEILWNQTRWFYNIKN
jgi:peptidyl-prolyl cis-trans isomerase SurA